MTATNRGRERNKDDLYVTPTWCVRRLLEACRLPGGRWLEPACGDGAIVRAVNAVRSDVRWCLGDVREEAVHEAGRLFADPDAREQACTSDFTDPESWRAYAPFDVVATNPPFTHAEAFVRRGIARGGFCVMLLRLPWLASGERAAFLRGHTPDVYVLPDRPSFCVSIREAFACDRCKKAYTAKLGATSRFCDLCGGACRHTGKSKTTSDATDYAWCVWPPGGRRTEGRLVVLAPTPREERAADRREPAP